MGITEVPPEEAAVSGAGISLRHGPRVRPAHPLQAVSFRCEALDEIEDQALAVTYWFDAPTAGDAFPVVVRFTGRRVGVKSRPSRRDSFEVAETIEEVVPGSGPVAITARVFDLAPGEWHVTATPTARIPRQGQGRIPGEGSRLARAATSAHTGFSPVMRVRAPGARLGAWPSLVATGVIVALALQGALARHRHLPATRVLLVSLVASLIGAAGAKVYYLIEHRRDHQGVLSAGMCIQGFVIGAIGSLVGGSALFGVPVGAVVDVSTPGLLFAMTIGRFGCFFGGCCAGRPTGSRWGLWSSDRRLGIRRIPTQLIEAALATAIGAGALGLVWSGTARHGGAVFVAALAAYTAGRQVLFPLRDLPRHTRYGRRLTLALALAAVAAALGAGVLS